VTRPHLGDPEFGECVCPYVLAETKLESIWPVDQGDQSPGSFGDRVEVVTRDRA
jgi:hypothetical protein